MDAPTTSMPPVAVEAAHAPVRRPRNEPAKLDLTGARVLVAGVGGFLGDYISGVLRFLGAEVIALVKGRGYDLRNEAEAFQAVMVSKPDIIVDASGPSGGIGFQLTMPGSIFRDTMQIGMNLVHVAAVARVRLIALGTSASYPSEGPSGAFRESSFWNGYPHMHVAAGGIARKAVLAMLQAYQVQFGLRFVYLVPSSVYGPDDNFDPVGASVLPAMIRRFVHAANSQADTVACWGDPEVTRSFLWAPDLSKAVALACATDLDYPHPINLAGAPEITMGALASLVAQETGYAGKITWDATKPTGTRRRVLDGRLAKKLLGWVPETSLETGLKATIQWYRHNGASLCDRKEKD